MENKGIVLKEKNQNVASEVGKDKKSKEVATVENVDEVEKNDDLMKNFQLKIWVVMNEILRLKT